MIPIAWSAVYAHPLPYAHRFPMQKYALLPDQLLREGIAGKDDFFVPKPMCEADILRVHQPQYWQRLSQLQLTGREQRVTGFPHTPELIMRERIIMQGTLECALYALRYGAALNIAGGTHHAYSDRGEGFCLLNDLALAAATLLDNGFIQRALIVDLDVHQGNGTAAIFKDESRVFTFSMHASGNYPLRKEQSDLDVGLPHGTSDREYIALLSMHLPVLLDAFKPDIVFYQSGVDVLREDKLGKLHLSHEACALRDRLVFRECSLRALPIVAVMGGGYAEKLSVILNAHAATFRAARDYYA
jgi:acetoin utilization deacetylase AcuC-like enzyme